MARTPVEQYYIGGFQGGWQPDMPQNQLEPNMVPDLMNVVFDNGYGIRKREGYRKITDNVTDLDTAGMLFLQRVFTATGEHPNFTQRALYFNENDYTLYYNTMGELVRDDQVGGGTDLTDSGHSMGDHPATTAVNYFRCWSLQAITYGSLIYITGLRFNGSSAGGGTPETDDGGTGASAPSKPIKYDVQAGTFSRPSVHSLAGGTTGFPAARACIVKYDRVFAANLYKKSVYRYPSRVYWSDAGTTETYQTNSFIDVSADDGNEVTSLLPFGEQILIFKNTSVWSLVGTDEDTFALYSLDNNLGCEATFGACTNAGTAYFFDYRTGVWAYDGARFTNISEPINETIFSNINRDSAFKVVLSAHQDRLFLTVPIGEFDNATDDHCTRTYMFDLNLKVWTQWDIGWVPYPSEYFTDYNVLGVGVSNDGRFFAGGLDDKVGIFKIEDPDYYSDGGSHGDTATHYQSFFETTWINPGNTGDRHRLRRLELLLSTGIEGITVDVFRDLNDDLPWSFGDVSTMTAHDFWHEIQPEHDIGLWTWLKVRVSDALED